MFSPPNLQYLPTPMLLGLFAPFLNDSVWNLCSVPLPTSDCRNGLQLNPPQDARNCTPQEVLVRLSNHVCQPNVGQPLVDALLQNSKCYSIARVYVDICGTTANNQHCGEFIGTEVINFGISSDPLLTSIESDCDSSLSSSVCSPSCQGAITNIANSYGCCVDALNISISGIQPEVPQLSYDLWNRCGVDTPGLCTASTLRLSGAANMKAIAWMIVVAMAILMALY